MDFAEFYRRSRDECLRTVLVSVGNQDTAQDLVAEAFARAWASWRTVSEHPAPKAWVVRTALNATISWWRRSADHGRADAAACPAPAGCCPGLFLGLDTGRTAEVLGITPGTIRAHLGRAIAALRADLMPGRQQETQS